LNSPPPFFNFFRVSRIIATLKIKMKKTILKVTGGALFVAALIAAPEISRAQDTNMPAVTPAPEMPAVAATNSSVKVKKPRTSLVASGKVSTVDTNAMTLTVGKHTFDITSETKINKNGEPAVLSDIAVDDKVGVSYKKADGGKLDATTINDGKKPADEKK
jgi:Domain of unknown function (DUF5666)